MTLTQMEYFVAAARLGNLTKAGEKLFVSQQAVSRQIQSLEQELGLELMTRSNKGIELTLAGEIFCQAWEQMLGIQQDALEQAAAAIRSPRKLLRVGIVNFHGVRMHMISVLEHFGRLHPELECSYEVDNIGVLSKQMSQGHLDLLISFEQETEPEGMEYLLLKPLEYRLGLSLGRNHPLGSREDLQLRDIQGQRLLLLKHSYSRKAARRVLDCLRREQIRPGEVEYFDNMETLELALSTGKGVAILFDLMLQGIGSHLVFYPLDMPREDYWEPLVVAWKDPQQEKYARALLTSQYE